MSVLDKILEFFGLKAGSTVLDPSSGPAHEDPTNRGQLRSPKHTPNAPLSAAAQNSSPADASASRLAHDALERERRERERLEQQLRESEEERRQLAEARSSVAQVAPQTAGGSPAPPFDSVTGNDRGGSQSPQPPEDDRTRNPNMDRAAGTVPTGVIVAMGGPNVGLVRVLSTGRNLVGRHLPGTKIAVPLRDDQQIISREHCEIECTGDRFTISPLETSSGELAATVVNDNVLERKTVLRDGATIRVFDNVLRFRSLEGAS